MRGRELVTADRARSVVLRSIAQHNSTTGADNIEVVQAQEALSGANENCILSLFSYNVAMISLARAIGSAETKLPELLGGK